MLYVLPSNKNIIHHSMGYNINIEEQGKVHISGYQVLEHIGDQIIT